MGQVREEQHMAPDPCTKDALFFFKVVKTQVIHFP